MSEKEPGVGEQVMTIDLSGSNEPCIIIVNEVR